MVGRVQDAAAWAMKAVAFARERGERGFEIGQRSAAHAHLTTAMTMYRDMGMRLWLEQAEAEQAELH